MAGSKLMKVLNGEAVWPPPVWIMRQAGRYLPEYRAARKEVGGFLDLCYNPDFAVEVTLQPIRRFGFDAAILFSDILVIPHALGRDLRFAEGEGPLLTPIETSEIEQLDTTNFLEKLAPVYETVNRLKKELPEETALIGFCGAPWTVATYMIAGRGTPDQAPARLFGHRHPEAFAKLLDILADVSADHLCRQIEEGADTVQIFDSWSGVLDEDCFRRYCIEPVAKIVRKVREKYPNVPIIGFPKGAGWFYRTYRQETGVTALGLDWTVPLDIAQELQKEGPVQGNMDPTRLVAGGRALSSAVERITTQLRSGPHIFNLGHGITPQTPIEHVTALVEQIRSGKA